MFAIRLIVLLLIILFLTDTRQKSSRETDRVHKMTVNGVSESRVVFVEVEIANDLDAPIVVPSCGQLLQKYVVCFPPAFFEQFNGAGWKRVEPTKNHILAELTAPPLVKIAPRESIEVRADFPPEVYDWASGQPVRLVISAWPASNKTKTQENEIRYVTGPLQPPSVGHLAFSPQ